VAWPTSGSTGQGFDFKAAIHLDRSDGGAIPISRLFLGLGGGSALAVRRLGGAAEHVNMSNTVCNETATNLERQPAHPLQQHREHLQRPRLRPRTYNPTRVPWTVGANYEITNQ